MNIIKKIGYAYLQTDSGEEVLLAALKGKELTGVEKEEILRILTPYVSRADTRIKFLLAVENLAKNASPIKPHDAPVIIPFSQLPYRVNEFVVFTANVVAVQEGVKEKEGKCSKEFLLIVSDLNDNANSARICVRWQCKENSNWQPRGIVKINGYAHSIPPSKPSPFKLDQLLVHAVKVEPTELDFKGYKPTKEDEENFRKYFGCITNENFEETIDKSIAPQVVGREKEKVGVALVLFSPLKIPVQGKKQFILTALNVGDTREGKDLICADIVENLCPAGAVSINAEMAKQTGLIGAIEKDALTGTWIITWGKLVQADGALAHLKGISGYDATAYSQLREILSDRKATITKVVRGEHEAKCRILATANCRKNVSMYPNKYCAFLDTGSRETRLFEESPDASRIHLPLVFAKDDVSTDLVDEAASKAVERLIPGDVFKNKIADAWRRELDDFDLNSIKEVLPQMHAILKVWRAKYPDFELTILGKEGNQLFVSLVMSCATIKHRMDSPGKIVVNSDDVAFVKSFVEWLFNDLGLQVELETKKKLKEEADRIAGELTKKIEEIELAENVEFYLKLLDGVYQKSLLSAKDAAKALDYSRPSFFRKKARAETYIADTLHCNEEILTGRTSKGFELTEFGVLLLRAIEKKQKGCLKW